MKGVVLAGGLGTRLTPLTRATNKHLLPIYDRPMIHFPVETLVDAGIEEILVVAAHGDLGDFRAALGDGRDLGVRYLTFAPQERDDGIVDALERAVDFAGGQRVCVIRGDTILERGIAPFVEAYRDQRSGARLLLTEVPDPQRFGVVTLDGDRIVDIVERPARPASGLAVTGVSLYDHDVFSICADLTPGARGAVEMTDVNNAYLRRGDLAFDTLEGWWSDADTFESLHRASCLVADARFRAERTLSVDESRLVHRARAA